MKKFFLPVIMLVLFAAGSTLAQTKAPITVKKAPAPVTKAPPITVTKAPPIMSAPATIKKPVAPAHVAKPAPAAKPVAVVHKPAAVKKTAAHATAHKAVAHHPAKKAKRVPVALKAPIAPVQEEVILPRPTEPAPSMPPPVIKEEERTRTVNANDDDDDNNTGDRKPCCHSCHHVRCIDENFDQPWRFRNRHEYTYDYIMSFYGKECGSCKKHCSHDKKKDKDNDN